MTVDTAAQPSPQSQTKCKSKIPLILAVVGLFLMALLLCMEFFLGVAYVIPNYLWMAALSFALIIIGLIFACYN